MDYTYTGGQPGYVPQIPFWQNRLNTMEQQYPQYARGQAQMPGNTSPYTPVGQLLKGRPVTSFDEAKAAMIDLDGSLFVFPDAANKCIYTKQIGLDGAAILKVYRLDEPVSPVQTGPQTNLPPDMVTREEFDRVFAEFQQRINRLQDEIGGYRHELYAASTMVSANANGYAYGQTAHEPDADDAANPKPPAVRTGERNGERKNKRSDTPNGDESL